MRVGPGVRRDIEAGWAAIERFWRSRSFKPATKMLLGLARHREAMPLHLPLVRRWALPSPDGWAGWMRMTVAWAGKTP